MTDGSDERAPGDGDREDCLSSDEVLAFVAEELDPDEQRRVDAHLERCASCTEELSAHYEGLERRGDVAVDAGFLTALQATLFGPMPAAPEVLDELWSTLARVRTELPFPLRVAPPRPSLAAAGLAVPHGSSPSGDVRWELATSSDSVRLSVWAKWPELAGTELELRIDGVPITGTPHLPHLVLAPGDGPELRAELEIRREHLEPVADSLVDSIRWRLDVGPVSVSRGPGRGRP